MSPFLFIFDNHKQKEMKEIAVIKPKNLNNLKQAITLSTTYNLGGREYSLDRFKNVLNGNINSDRGDFRFDGVGMQEVIRAQSVEDVKEALDFFLNHPLIEDVNGKAKSGAYFTIEILEKTKEKKKAKTVNVNRVVSMVYGMSEADRKDVMYFFRQNPRGMSDDDITLILVDIEDGLLIKEPNTSLFLSTFGSMSKSSVAERVEMMVYVNKGLVSGFVTEDAKKFYIGDTLIGKDEDDIALFFKENQQMYDNLVKSLADAGDETAYNELYEDEEDEGEETPFAVRLKWEKLFKKYKLKGKFPANLDRAIERINAYEKKNGLELSE